MVKRSVTININILWTMKSNKKIKYLQIRKNP